MASGSSFYLDQSPSPHLRPDRPLAPGDVFVDSAFTWAPKYKSPFDPATAVKSFLTLAMLVGHPCGVYAGSRPATCPSVVQVRPKVEVTKERPFEAPWSGFTYLFPLPELLDGVDYVADFRRVSAVHYKYLSKSRIACLSRGGWSLLHRRYVAHTSRIEITSEESADALEEYWNEFELWEEWNKRGLNFDDFQVWLQAASSSGLFEGTPRSRLLKFALDEVLREMPAAGGESIG